METSRASSAPPGPFSIAEDILQIHFTLNIVAAVRFLPLFQHGPAIGDDHEAAAHLHYGDGDAEKVQNVRTNEK